MKSLDPTPSAQSAPQGWDVAHRQLTSKVFGDNASDND